MNYYEYFSEIEERFTTRRGSLLLLSTLDWALIETWREAGVPLAAVLRGIDAAFDRHDARKSRGKGRLAKVNGLAWCAQAVMEAAAELAEAAVGSSADRSAQDTGFEPARVVRFLVDNAAALNRVATTSPSPQGSVVAALTETAGRLLELANEVRAGASVALDELDRTLSVLEERLYASVIAGVSESELLSLRETAERELAPYRARMSAVQLRQIREQFIHKRLFEAQRLPRLSLFYMPLDESPGDEAAA